MSQSIPSGKHLRGLTRCWCGYWLQPLLQRQEVVERMLTLFDPEEESHRNAAVFFRVSHVYASDPERLGAVCELLRKDSEIASAQLLHERSDLGLPWKLVAMDREGREIIYDGLVFRVTEQVEPPDFDLADLGENPGWPLHASEVVWPLGRALAQHLPNFDDIGVRSTGFYVAEQVDWKKVGLRASPQAQFLLRCTDLSIHTLTALTEHSVGRQYEICLGRRDDAIAMMVNAFAHYHEVETLIEYVRGRQKEAVLAGLAITSSSRQLLSPSWQVWIRVPAWRALKQALRRIVELRAEAGLLDLARMGLEETVDQRLTAVPAAVQMWDAARPPDPQRGVQRERAFFHTARLERGAAVDVSDRASMPPYAHAVAALGTKLNLHQKGLREFFDEGRSATTGFQTEFGFYAVCVGMLGVLVAVLIAIMSSCLLLPSTRDAPAVIHSESGQVTSEGPAPSSFADTLASDDSSHTSGSKR